MPKKRLPDHKGLPRNWRFKNGSYRYRVPLNERHLWGNKAEATLGKTLGEAYRKWAEKQENIGIAKTINDLLDRYRLEIVPTHPPGTQALYEIYMVSLRKVFGHMIIEDLKPRHIYGYLEARKKKKKCEDGRYRGGVSAANKEIGMFSDVFSKAIKWGRIDKHPFKGQIEYLKEEPRTRYIENWELDSFMSLEPLKGRRDSTRLIQAYVAVKILTGLRQQDMLSLKIHDIKPDGLHVTPQKTRHSSGKKLIIEWTPALREAINHALSIRKVDISPYVFCTRTGASFYDAEKKDPASGWKTMFKRYMDRVLTETEVSEKFTEHDLRAKTASDLNDIGHAQKLLAHTSQRTTQKHYRRLPERVKPSK